MTVIVLLGGPGAGKGTQAQVLRERLGIPHVSTGDLFRSAVRDGSPIGLEARRYMERGHLVPDEITIRMLLARLAADDARGGAILDGFPRNRTQAAALDHALAEHDGRVDRALSIEVPEEELVRRLSGRWICAKAGHVYNDQTNPPKVAGRCDLDGSELIQRVDDQADTIRTRLAEQLGALADVVDHYRSTGVLRSVDGTGPIESVTAGLLAGLDDARPAEAGRPVSDGAA
jgi:adenylate kinase